jgi:hypothetical protein
MKRETMPGYCLASKPVNRSSIQYAMRGSFHDVALALAGGQSPSLASQQATILISREEIPVAFWW